MARQMRSTFSNELLTIPPPIVGTEVSARWKRTWKGEVVMTVIMPNDVVDTEVYVKTSQGHIGIQMDPWMSCSWKRTWNSTHPLTPRPRKRSGSTDYRKQAEESVFSRQLEGLPIASGTATGHPGQSLDVTTSTTPTTIAEELHLQSSKLLKTTGYLLLPRSR